MVAYTWIAENWGLLLWMWLVWGIGFFGGAMWGGRPRYDDDEYPDTDWGYVDPKSRPPERKADAGRHAEQRRITGPAQ